MAVVMRQVILSGIYGNIPDVLLYERGKYQCGNDWSHFLIARVINAVVALLTGWLIDNTHSKYGKARPWLLWFAVPFGIVTFAIFAVPDVAKLYQIIYVFIAYNAMMSVYSLINIPYGSMATMMTKDQYQRTLLNIFRQLFAQIASLLVTAEHSH